MKSVREISKSIIAEMEGIRLECRPGAAEYHRRMALIGYADALKGSPYRSKELNEIAFREAESHATQAIAFGVSADRLDESFARLRAYWIPRLEVRHGD